MSQTATTLSPKAEKIKTFLDRTGLSKTDFSTKAGVSIHTVNSWFRDPSWTSYREVPDSIIVLIDAWTELEQAKAASGDSLDPAVRRALGGLAHAACELIMRGDAPPALASIVPIEGFQRFVEATRSAGLVEEVPLTIFSPYIVSVDRGKPGGDKTVETVVKSNEVVSQTIIEPSTGIVIPTPQPIKPSGRKTKINPNGIQIGDTIKLTGLVDKLGPNGDLGFSTGHEFEVKDFRIAGNLKAAYAIADFEGVEIEINAKDAKPI